MPDHIRPKPARPREQSALAGLGRRGDRLGARTATYRRWIRRVVSVREALLTIGIFVVLLWWVLSLHLAYVPWEPLMWACVGVAAGQAVQVLVHEVGHLVVALVVGLRVRGMRLFGRRVFGTTAHGPGRPASAVSLDITRPYRFFPVRAAVTFAAGPTANLSFAMITYAVAEHSQPSATERALCVGLTLAGTLVGIGSLLPHTSSTLFHSDGRQIASWLGSPRARTSELADQRAALDLPSSADTETDRAALRAGADSGRAAIAGPAAYRLLKSLMGETTPNRDLQLWAEADRMCQVAQLPNAPAGTAAHTASALGFALAGDLLVAQLEHDLEPSTDQLAILHRLAQIGHHQDPTNPLARDTLALVLLLNHYPHAARDLFTGQPERGLPTVIQNRGRAIHALAEISLGNPEHARQLLDLPDSAERPFPVNLANRVLQDVLVGANRSA